MGKTIQEVKEYIVRKLGGGIEDVELTEEHLNDIIDDTNRWFVFRVGQKTIVRLFNSGGSGQTAPGAGSFIVSSAPGQTHFILPDHVLEVLNVRTVQQGLETASLGTDDFSYAYSFLFGSFYTNSQYGGSSMGTNYAMSPFPYSDLVQRLQMLETVSRIWGGDPEWEWRKESRELVIAPAAQTRGTILVEVFTSQVDPRHLDPEELDFYLRWALAEAMETLGEIRRKYDSYPTVGGDRAMNGDALVGDSLARKEKLEIQVLNRIRSTPFVIG